MVEYYFIFGYDIIDKGVSIIKVGVFNSMCVDDLGKDFCKDAFLEYEGYLLSDGLSKENLSEKVSEILSKHK